MSKKLKDADNYEELFMKRKERLVKYKEGSLGPKAKKFLGFPQKVYQNWEAHWTLDDEPKEKVKKVPETEEV